MSFPLIRVVLCWRCFLFFPNGFANKNTAAPNFSLVNQSSLDKILKVEVFVHSDGQLWATHLILGYTPISKSFQVPKCVIKAKDPCLHQISVAILGFLVADPIPKGIPKATLPLQYTTGEATFSHPTIKEEEEEERKEEEEKEEEVVEVSDSEDNFSIFN